MAFALMTFPILIVKEIPFRASFPRLHFPFMVQKRIFSTRDYKGSPSLPWSDYVFFIPSLHLDRRTRSTKILEKKIH